LFLPQTWSHRQRNFITFHLARGVRTEKESFCHHALHHERCRAFLLYDGGGFVSDIGAWGTEMAKKITRIRPWTKEEVRMLKTLAREQTKTTVIARKLKRSVAAVYLRASKLAVMLGGGRGRKGT
jgi:hypothetical protein